MKIKYRVNNGFIKIKMDPEEAKGKWLNVDIETGNPSQEEIERRIQAAVNEQYNKPEYNNWHKFDRHRGDSKAQAGDDGEMIDTSEPLMAEVRDDRIFRKDEIAQTEKESFEAICQWIREVLKRKPEWAEMFIAIRLDGVSYRDYAARTGMSENSISQKLKRATKKLKENWDNRQI